jgi:hypothetical protein
VADAHRYLPDGLPDELLDAPDLEILRVLEQPSLIRLPGTGRQPPRAIAALLHGDEFTGLQAVLRILRRRSTHPFDLYVLLGNIPAALAGNGFAHRYLDDQEDFNRVWGPTAGDTPLRQAAAEILDRLRGCGLESLVDVHNNTGDNPFYAIVTRHRPEVINLATLFTTTLLHWDLGANTLMEALEDDCAAIAVECGLPGRPESLAFAVDGLRRYLGEPPLPTDRVVRDHELLGDLRKVVIRDDVDFRFGGEVCDGIDLALDADADVHNFVEVPAGHRLGRVRPGAPLPVRATDAAGTDVTERHFAVRDDVLITTVAATPVMMTRTVEAARKDCLFYLAEGSPDLR